jgi:hypothetical protein
MISSKCVYPRLRGLVAVVLVAMSLVIAPPSSAQGVPQLTVGHLTGEDQPVIDGTVDEALWSAETAYSTFTQQEPSEGQPATERTDVWFVIDETNLYVAIVCYDSEPGNLVISQSRRDADLLDTDSVQILLDTFNDGQNAFVFGTNPFGIEYDAQVMAEGQTGGGGYRSGGFNLNWDADWTVSASSSERGWEAEFAIPLRTLRYNPGEERVWGVNVQRNIRRKNEQVFLAPVPRGYSLQRVSVAGKLNGLSLPSRRDLKFTPFVAGSFNDDKTLVTDTVDRSGDIGLDVKWGVRADLTLDLSVNTDFAQVEADEEQVNLTRFALFFPEKRPFFLENAQVFQLGQPRNIDLFFSRRIGLAGGQPVDILGAGRLSGKLGGLNVGLLNVQTDSAVDRRTGETISQANNFSVVRVQREVGRSNFGAMFVNRQGVGDLSPADDYNRAFGLDLAWQATTNGRLFAFISRTDSPARKGGSDYAGRVNYNYANDLWSGNMSYSQVGEHFNPEVGFLPRLAYRRVEGRYALSYQPQGSTWIRRFAPHVSYRMTADLENRLETSRGHFHFFEIRTNSGARFGYVIDTLQDRPREAFPVHKDVTGRQVVIPTGEYSWVTGMFEGGTDPSKPISLFLRQKVGQFYDGDYFGWDATLSLRAGARLISEVGWKRDDINLPGGSFTTDLIPVKVSYALTSLTSLQALVQYNRKTSTISSNIRLALLNRSNTGLFLVYNDRRDTSPFRREEVLGRSFIVKFTRLIDL